jgi:hypothetical protein
VTVHASFLTDFWNEQLVSQGRQGVFLLLLGFLGSFAFIRMSTRLMRSPRVPWWPGSVVSEGGVHVHHLVFGIIIMLAAGTLAFANIDSPWWELSALLFGIGAGLTIDEFALFVHLEDVYWAEEGRSSVDATVIAAAGIGLVLLGVRPFDVASGSAVEVISSLVTGALFLAVVMICFLKGRIMHGAIGFFVFPLAIYGACRLGKPGSAWARRRYGKRNPEKQARAEARFPPDRRTERFKKRFRDAVGGTPTEVYEAKLADRASANPPKP